jgi:hypothetical protein
MDAHRTDELTQQLPAARPPSTESAESFDDTARDIDERFEALARSLTADLTMTRGRDEHQPRQRRHRVVVVGLLILSAVLLAVGLATPRLAWWFAGAGAFIASFVVDARHRRWPERRIVSVR